MPLLSRLLVPWQVTLAMFRARQGRLWQEPRTRVHRADVRLRPYGSYSAPKHLRMEVPPYGRRCVDLRGRGRSQRCHWLHQVQGSGVRVLLGLETPSHGRAALRAAQPCTS